MHKLLGATKRSLKRSVYGRLRQRYIFNFRLNASILHELLPVSWLKPQIINEYAVMSFCIIELDGLTIWPLPTSLGIDTVSCAYRFGVIDESGGHPMPSVFIVNRNTDLPIISAAGPILIHNSMPRVNATILHHQRGTSIKVSSASNGSVLFSATANCAQECRKSKSRIFGSKDQFVKFIHDGSSSYAQSTNPNFLTRVDVFKNDLNYIEMDAKIDKSSIGVDWIDRSLDFDSAFRAEGGGIYKWTYLGLVPIRCGELLEDVEIRN